MEFVDPEDGSPAFREPPPPDDRLWRHPSELPTQPGESVRAGAALTDASPKEHRTRQMWLYAGASAAGASILT
ncbi:MAG TPA: hypothetical protein VF711_05495, partial [Acidimicrobiales bacterium]